MLKDINIGSFGGGYGSDINMPDWEITPPPRTTTSFLPSFRDAYNIQAPSSTQNKPFPDYAVIEPDTIQSFLHSLAISPDVGLGAIKNLPGFQSLNTVGDFLGGLGRGVEQSPVGAPLDAFRGAVTGGAGAVMSSLLESVASAKNLLLAPNSITGQAGVTARNILEWSGNKGSGLDQALTFNQPKDLKEALGEGVSALSLIPVFKGAGLLAKAGGALPIAGDLLKGVTSALTRQAVTDATAFKAGQLLGRAALVTEGVGLGAEFTLPKIAPNEPWAKDILNNRVVAEDSPWRFPWEAATLLPLDLVQLTKLGTSSRLFAKAQQAAFGPAALPTQIHFGGEFLQNALQGSTIDARTLNLLDDYALRQTAENYLVRDIGETYGQVYKTASDLPIPQAQLSVQIKAYVDKLYKELGPTEFHRQAAETLQKDFNRAFGDWSTLDQPAQLSQFNEYADLVRRFEAGNPEVTIGVARDAAFAKMQAPEALGYLKQARATWDSTAAAEMANRYPALSQDFIKVWGDDPDKLIMELGNIVSSANVDELAGIRVQLGQSDAKIQALLKQFDEQAQIVRKANTRMTNEQRASDAGKTTKAQAANQAMQDDDILKRLSAKIQDEMTRYDELMSQHLAYQPAAVGSMQSALDALNRKIVLDGQLGLVGERDALLGKIKTARELQGDELRRQIDAVQSSMMAREAELSLSTTGVDDNAVIDGEWETMNDQLSQLNRDYMEAQLTGSRWTLKDTPAGPVMRLEDELGEKFLKAHGAERGDRTFFGETYDKLFAGIQNRDLGSKAFQYFTEKIGGANGLKATKELYTALDHDVELDFQEFSTGHRRAPVANIWHMSPTRINNIAKDLGIKTPDGFKSIAEVVFRAYPGPIKTFMQNVFDHAQDIPYFQAYHEATRHLYPMFRFYFSPRFLAMNFFESPIIGVAGGGKEFLQAQADPTMLKWSKIFSSDLDEQALSHGPAMHRNIAKLGEVMAGDRVVKAVLDSVATAPEMEDIVKTMGGRDNWYPFLQKTVEERINIVKNLNTATARENALADDITGMRRQMRGQSAGDKLLTRDKINKAQSELDTLVGTRRVREEAAKQGLSNTDKYQPFLTAMTHEEIGLVHDLRGIFYGNPARSATERLLNSFMLYWPISYQIKATKILADFMFSRGFGFKTGSVMSDIYAHARQDIETKMKTDADTARFFEKNKNLLFLARQLLPVTPEDIGVSLSPWIRAPRDVATGKKSLAQAAGSLVSIGPAYDLSLIQRIFSEQSKPGGIFHDLINGDNNAQ